MTTKTEYLKRCTAHLKVLEYKRWYINAFGIPLPAKHIEEDYELASTAEGMHYWCPDKKELVKIVDAKMGEPLFTMKDEFAVTPDWHPLLKEQKSVRLGNLLLNVVAIYPAIAEKIGYMAGPIKMRVLENRVAEKMRDAGEGFDEKVHVSVEQYLDCMDRLWFFTSLANLFTVAATSKMITEAPGIGALRAKLLEENKDKLNDPVVVASVIEQLNAYDKEYLKDDSDAVKILGKKGATSRKKLFMMYGETLDFDQSLGAKPVLSRLTEGLDTSEEVFPKYINDLRYASYSRGHSTQMSGYGYKILQRALASLEILDTPCNTQRGFERLVTKDVARKLSGRYVLEGKQWTLVKDDAHAGTYLGKRIQTRSAMYCTSPGFTYCYACLNETYKGSKTAMTNIAANLSGVLMTIFLKQMHKSGFSLAELKQEDWIT